MVGTLASKTHRTMHYCDTDESMVPLFTQDPDGSSSKSKYIMGKRNWTAVTWDPSTGEMLYDIRVEKEKGCGQTVGWVHLRQSLWHLVLRVRSKDIRSGRHLPNGEGLITARSSR
jgi:hypothetical protein